ncbi:amidohydrolase [Paracnuella aquatica]|uniref:amidohydrolase n=1 Tax=Paracnuella aquatica TaxID=2268757 RepID=UPI000DF0182C|nr:amidohydrolase [Paracnuella aquatica]RPD50879.1 amidohydrolase [Paracnuella aquatica]
MSKRLLFPTLLLSCALHMQAQKAPATQPLKTAAAQNLQAAYPQYKDIALQIWNWAELGYKEERSAALLAQALEREGFKMERGVAGIPTAFIATYGSGAPVIGILAEYDALPGLSQEAVPEKKPIAGQAGGHGCGHHLFGTASVAAAIEVKKLIESGKLKGTVKLYGTPAEEGGSGKVYLVREGLFKDVDAVLHWHPSSENSVTMTSALANSSAKFRFYGTSAHASAAPERGRSALDAVEAMNFMVNMMREHIPSDARIHYVITQGGKAPNVVPDFAEVYYYVRHPNREVVRQIFDRVVKASQGAATGTETRTDYETIGGTYDLLVNKTLAAAMQQALQQVGGVSYTSGERDFAQTLQKSLGADVPHISDAEKVQPLKSVVDAGGGSTDVGDVSWTVPTVGLRTATWVPGVPAHSWQAVASGGTEIGTKGMINAAKVLAFTAVDLFTNPALIQAAKEEFNRSRGNSFQYKPLLGNRPPALNYRD